MAATNGNGIETQRERLTAAVKEIERLGRNDDELFAKYDGVGRTNWTIVLSAIGVATVIMGGLWGLTTAPIMTDLKEQQRFNRTIDEIYVRKDVLEARRAEFIARMMLIEAQAKDAIQRPEYIERQRAMEQQILHITARAEEVRRDLNSIFPTTKVMDELLRRIDRLETGRVAAPSAK